MCSESALKYSKAFWFESIESINAPGIAIRDAASAVCNAVSNEGKGSRISRCKHFHTTNVVPVLRSEYFRTRHKSEYYISE